MRALCYPHNSNDEVAEWLRRWTANPMGSARVGSNPANCEHFCPGKKMENKIYVASCGV